MRVVLDTNVLLSAVLFGGTPGRILDASRTGQVEFVMSPDFVDECVRVGERLNERYPDVDIQPIVALVVQNATIVSSIPLPRAVCDDPDDEKFLACALASGTKVIVSGDKKLGAVSGDEGINVLTPRQFADRWLCGGERFGMSVGGFVVTVARDAVGPAPLRGRAQLPRRRADQFTGARSDFGIPSEVIQLRTRALLHNLPWSLGAG